MHLSTLPRRDFIRHGTLSLASMAVAWPGPAVAAGTHPQAADVLTLGRSGVRASRQGAGFGDGKAEAFQRMGPAGFTRMIRHMLDQGVRYFDLLPGPIHSMLARALKGVPRESYALVTNFRHPEETNPARMIDRYLQELETDYLDAVLAGAILTGDWATQAKWSERRDLLSAAKHNGKVRAHGVSVHGWDALGSLAADRWVELALVSCNHQGSWMDGPTDRSTTDLEKRDLSAPVLRGIRAAGIGLAAMKVFAHSGYRDAARPAEERLKALRYVLSLRCFDTLPILCESIEEFDEVTRLLNQAGRELESADPGSVL